ncbi:MAG: 2-isopropylmalate synthase [Polyangiaceae bacterium]
MSFDPHRYVAPERVHLPDRTWPERSLTAAPVWCSVDLRDGNQALPDPMGHARKRALFELLVRVGFKQIELGFPSASRTDFDFIRWVLESGALPADVIPQVITQSREALIERTLESVAGTPRAIVHLYNSTSELQRRVVFGMNRRQIVDLALRGTHQIRERAAALNGTRVTFQYSPESFTGTEFDFGLEICNAVIEAWGPTPDAPMIINLPSTVENTTPNVFADRIEWMSRNLARRDSVVLSVHTHNDRGAGVAAAELSMLAGAQRVEGTLLGNGERSGNVDIVTLAMNLYSHGVDPGLRFEDMKEVVRVVEECTRLPVHPRHPYAGELVFAAFSGSHQDAIHKGYKHMAESPGARWEVPYLPIDPADIGRQYEPVIRINSQSGKSGLLHVLERDFGYRVPRELAIEFSKAVQAVTDAQGEEMSSGAVHELFEATYLRAGGDVALDSVGVERRESGRECAVSARLSLPDGPRDVQGIGGGPIEAFAHAVASVFARPFEVVDYSEHARGSGADAEAVAYVAARVDGIVHYGVGRDTDVVVASLRALVAALNRASRVAATAFAAGSTSAR